MIPLANNQGKQLLGNLNSRYLKQFSNPLESSRYRESIVYDISKEYGMFMVLLVQGAFIPGFKSFPQRNSKTKAKTKKLTC